VLASWDAGASFLGETGGARRRIEASRQGLDRIHAGTRDDGRGAREREPANTDAVAVTLAI